LSGLPSFLLVGKHHSRFVISLRHSSTSTTTYIRSPTLFRSTRSYGNQPQGRYESSTLSPSSPDVSRSRRPHSDSRTTRGPIRRRFPTLGVDRRAGLS